MVLELWGPWDDQTEGSTTKLNGVSVISDTGFNLENYDKTLFRMVFCTEDGADLIKDHTYAVDTAAETFIDISSTGSHTHTGTGEGGSIFDIYRSNPKYFDLSLTKTTDLKKAAWLETAGGSGTAEDVIDGASGEHSIKLRPNTISGDSYTIQYPHLQIDFSKRSMFQMKVRMQVITAVALHSGVNCDPVTVVDTNTVKYSAEVCTVSNANWNIRTASGSSTTSSDTGTAIATTRAGIRIEHFPDLGTPEVDMYINAGTVFQKTSTIPVTGTSEDNNLIMHSVKNSTTADCPYHIYGTRLCYFVSDNWI